MMKSLQNNNLTESIHSHEPAALTPTTCCLKTKVIEPSMKSTHSHPKAVVSRFMQNIEDGQEQPKNPSVAAISLPAFVRNSPCIDVQLLGEVLPALVRWRFLFFYCLHYDITDFPISTNGSLGQVPVTKRRLRICYRSHNAADALLDEAREKLVATNIPAILSIYLKEYSRHQHHILGKIWKYTSQHSITQIIQFVSHDTGIPLRQFIRAMILYIKYLNLPKPRQGVPLDYSKPTRAMMDLTVTHIAEKKNYAELASLVHLDLEDLRSSSIFTLINPASTPHLPSPHNMQQTILKAVGRCSAHYFSRTYYNQKRCGCGFGVSPTPSFLPINSRNPSTRCHDLLINNPKMVTALPFDLPLPCPGPGPGSPSPSSPPSSSTSNPKTHPETNIRKIITYRFATLVHSISGIHLTCNAIAKEMGGRLEYELSRREKMEMDGQVELLEQIARGTRNGSGSGNAAGSGIGRGLYPDKRYRGVVAGAASMVRGIDDVGIERRIGGRVVRGFRDGRSSGINDTNAISRQRIGGHGSNSSRNSWRTTLTSLAEVAE